MIKSLLKLRSAKGNFYNRFRTYINAFKNVKTNIFRGVNIHLIHFFNIDNKRFGGPKDTLNNFREIDRYVEKKKRQGMPYFSWKFFKGYIDIKNPELTIGNPLLGAEVTAYRADTTEHVYLMPNIRIYSKDFFSLTEDNYLLGPVSNYYSDNKNAHPAFGTLILPKCKVLKGRSIIIRGGAYWHKVQDGLPAIYLAQLAGFDIDKIDHFIIQDKIIDNNTIFTRSGIPIEKQVRLHDPKECYNCEELIFSSWYDRKGSWYKDFLIEKIKPETIGAVFPKKIYLSRSMVDTRKVLNEDEVVEFLKKYGFECLHNENLSFDEQISLFQNATHVISCHGSQLTNIVFCKPGTKVLEIRHIAHKIHYRKAFHDLSNGFGLYYYLLYSERGEPYLDKANNIVETDTHMYIDLADMKTMLEKMDLKEVN